MYHIQSSVKIYYVLKIKHFSKFIKIRASVAKKCLFNTDSFSNQPSGSPTVAELAVTEHVVAELVTELAVTEHVVAEPCRSIEVSKCNKSPILPNCKFFPQLFVC
jgi:hypothetical protein